MKLSWLLLALTINFDFPRDHFDHPGFQTEWWYYTGNLIDPAGHAFGFELTFFRQALDVSPQEPNLWRPDQLYLAHFALSDIDGREFYHAERLNRAGPGLAGASIETRKYWNGNWRVYWKDLARGEQQLQAVSDRFTLTLNLTPLKPPVVHGKDGVSRKGPAPGEASHYVSFTRLAAQGQLSRGDSTLSMTGQALTGQAWMDHEFFTQPPNPTLAGWDWFAIQLDNNEELMLYRLRTKSGEVTPFSSGTYVDSTGAGHFLNSTQFQLSPGGLWHSPESGANYPLNWRIEVPSLGLDLRETTPLDKQELFTPSGVSPSYWEGAVNYAGTIHNQPIRGKGYLEMTGYLGPIRLGH